MSFRQIKRKMRRDLHNVLKVPAMYVPNDGSTPFAITVRLHYVLDLQGDLKGTNYHYAEKQDIEPSLIIFRDQVPMPYRGDIVAIEPGEAWRIDNVEKPDDETTKSVVTRVAANDPILLTLPFPTGVL